MIINRHFSGNVIEVLVDYPATDHAGRGETWRISCAKIRGEYGRNDCLPALGITGSMAIYRTVGNMGDILRQYFKL
jgi:hypothetical protein